MSSQQAKQTVLVAMLILIAISVYRQKADPGTLYKRVWGTGVLGLMLSLLADFAPAIAGPFAVVTVLGTMTKGGDKALLNLLGSGPATPGTPGSTAGSGPPPSTSSAPPAAPAASAASGTQVRAR